MTLWLLRLLFEWVGEEREWWMPVLLLLRSPVEESMIRLDADSVWVKREGTVGWMRMSAICSVSFLSHFLRPGCLNVLERLLRLVGACWYVSLWLANNFFYLSISNGLFLRGIDTNDCQSM